MLRLTGILIGSAIAVAFLIVAVGVPEFSKDEPESATEVPAIAAEPDVSVEADMPAEPAEQIPAEPEPEPEVEPVLADLSIEESEALIEQIFTPDTATEPVPVLEENWYSFWSPFRSEIAANGFVSGLQETTGIDYRVVKVKTGVYEVAFAYLDDQDVQDKLARISAATGLDMSGG
jgi:hypothetical protein